MLITPFELGIGVAIGLCFADAITGGVAFLVRHFLDRSKND